jgi:hypothetical protein
LFRILVYSGLFFLLLTGREAQAQAPAGRSNRPVIRAPRTARPTVRKRPAKKPRPAPQTPAVLPEGPNYQPRKAIVFSDTLKAGADTLRGDLEDEVKYTAADSVIYDGAASRVFLYHDARVEYTNLVLTAEYIEIDLKNNLAYASGRADSTGKIRGKPVFTQGADKYEAQTMAYNFKTRRARIQGIVTRQGEGFIHGESVKKTPENDMYIREARYTTCNLGDPHFYIQAGKIKVIPGKKLITGPFNLHFMDLPTPFGFAFGIFPTPQTASSGIIVPTYGEAVDRGFFLRNGGYYWHISDYVDARFLGDIYSKGSYGISVLSSYRKRYAFSGNLEFRYANRRSGDDDLSQVGKDYWLQWTHTPETRGNRTFSASVNLGSPDYNRRNSFSTTNYLATNFNSTVSYSQALRGTPFSYTINAQQTQDVASRESTIKFPTATLNMAQVYPFRRRGAQGKRWFEKIRFSYAMAMDNTLRNRVSPASVNLGGARAADLPQFSRDTILPLRGENMNFLLGQMQNGMSHTLPVSTSFTLARFFQTAISLNYNEYWYRSRLRYTWLADENAVDVDTIRGFSRAYTAAAAVSVQTRAYGLVYIRRGGIEAIRHVLNPSVGFSYRPDFSDPRLGMTQDVQVDAGGRKARLSPFQGALYGGAPAQGASGAVSLGLTNNLEMKVKNRKDTSGKQPFKKISLLDNLAFNSSYNLIADSFRLAPVTFSGLTRLFETLTLNFSGTLDPYGYRRAVTGPGGKVIQPQRRLRNYAWQESQGIGRLSFFNLALSTSLNPKAREKKNLKKKFLTPQEERELEFINANPELFVDFSVPWNLNIAYNFSRSRNGFDKAQTIQSLTLTGDLNLTSKWKIGASSGYDFVNRTLVYPNINIYRDLHCWEMRFNWIPTGNRGSYSIDINVKASVLQDLKLSRRRSWFDR